MKTKYILASSLLAMMAWTVVKKLTLTRKAVQ